MKKALLIKMVVFVLAFTILNLIGKETINRVFDVKADIFIAMAFFKLSLLIFTLILLKKEDYIDYKYLNKNKVVVISISAILIALSLSGTNSKINEQQLAVTDIEHYGYFFQCLTVGFFEEFFCRVLIFAMVCKLLQRSEHEKPYREVVYSSIIFGILHLSNLLNPNYDSMSVITQVLFAIVIGLLLQSLLIKFKNVWLVAILHCLMNYYGMRKAKLFGIQSVVEESGSNLSELLDSMITFTFLCIIVLPTCYLLLRTSENLLVKPSNIN